MWGGWDGTGNEVKDGARSKVLELYNRLNHGEPTKQLAYYDPGLGTLPAPGLQSKLAKRVTKVLGLGFGYCLPQTLQKSYTFVLPNYSP